MSKRRYLAGKGPRRGVFMFEVTGPRKGRDTPILWPPRLPPWHGETERRQAAGYMPDPSAPFFFCKREDFRVELFIGQGGLCHWCSKPMSMERRRVTVNGRLKDNRSFATFEHLRPKSMGGGFNRKNIRLAHGSCNAKRPIRKFPHDPYADVLAGLVREMSAQKNTAWCASAIGKQKIESSLSQSIDSRGHHGHAADQDHAQEPPGWALSGA